MSQVNKSNNTLAERERYTKRETEREKCCACAALIDKPLSAGCCREEGLLAVVGVDT